MEELNKYLENKIDELEKTRKTQKKEISTLNKELR